MIFHTFQEEWSNSLQWVIVIPFGYIDFIDHSADCVRLLPYIPCTQTLSKQQPQVALKQQQHKINKFHFHFISFSKIYANVREEKKTKEKKHSKTVE